MTGRGDKQATTREVLRFYRGAASRYPRHLAGILVTLPITTLVNNVLPPLVVAHTLDRLSRHDYEPGHLWRSFGSAIVLYVVLLLLGGTVMWRIVDQFAWRLEGHVQRDLAQRSFGHLVEESSDFHANSFGGSLVSDTNKLLGSYVRIADTTMFQVVPLFVTVVAVVIATVGRNPLFAGLLVVFTAVYVALSFTVSAPVRRAGAAYARSDSAQTGVLADMVTNVMAVKSFAREAYEKRRYGEYAERTHEGLLRMMRVHGRQNSVFGTVTGATGAMAFVVTVWGVVDRGQALGTIFLVLTYTVNITQQLFQFSNNALRTYNRAIGDASTMVATLAQTPSVVDPEVPEGPRIRAGAVRFEDVTFTHAGADDALFHRFDLDIAPGQKVGLVGHSGAGKSTVVKLLLRFSDVDGGRITIDGQDIAAIRQSDLHDAVAYVPQEPLLFHRSIRENIAYGRLEAPAEDVELAARRAHAADFVDGLPAGYRTLVGERGVKLSGGQRQRIAIARAMVKDAPVLLLDEATSALDSESELLIQDALWQLMEGRTTVVIAHRLATVRRLDRIVVLDEGRIVEDGSHDELLALDGVYAGFWAHQSGGLIGA